MKGWYKALEDLVWLTQLGLNMLLPLVMCTRSQRRLRSRLKESKVRQFTITTRSVTLANFPCRAYRWAAANRAAKILF